MVTGRAAAAAAAKRVLKAISSPVLAKVRIEAEGFELGEVVPQPCPDVFAARPLAVNGRWRGKPEGTLIVRGIAGNGGTITRLYSTRTIPHRYFRAVRE